MTVTIRLLGQFEVKVDGVPVPDPTWTRRHAASLVKLLALADGRRLHREQVVEALWPGTSLEAAAPRLHKAAHYARRALGTLLPEGAAGLVLRGEMVTLLPGEDVRVDAVDLLRDGRSALEQGSRPAAEQALASYGGPLLPDDPYAPWAEEPREAVRVLHLDLLRLAGRWEQVLQEEPADEAAHLALARAAEARGDRRAGLRQLERLDRALRREFGTTAGREVEELRARLGAAVPVTPVASAAPVAPVAVGAPGGAGAAGSAARGAAAQSAEAQQPVRLVGRRHAGEQVRGLLGRAGQGRGGTLLVTGPPGVGKTAVLDLAAALAERDGWRVGRGSASAVDAAWPYAAVLEAFAAVCRRHPALLDGLADTYRVEIERTLSGRDVSWTGESSHQRLFVAVAELMRLAAAGHGLLLVVDDLHEADEASLRLLHYLSRCAVTEPVAVVAAYRPSPTGIEPPVLESLVRRDTGSKVELAPLGERAVLRLLADRRPDLDPEALARIATLSAGLPFRALELARTGGSGDALVAALPPDALRTFRRVALLGGTFTTDEVLALSDGDEDQAYRELEAAAAALVVGPAEAGWQFRHSLVRDALRDSMSPQTRARFSADVATRMADRDASPARLARLFLAAGLPSRAVPYVVRAVDTAGALGAYRDALELLQAVLPHATGDARARLLARRGDLLLALGEPEAVAAYREAVGLTTGTEHRLVRARLARAASFTGDLETARAALAGLAVEGDEADGPILLARGNIAYFAGDVDTAWEAAGQARDLLATLDDPWQMIDLISLQGLIAHQRGEWFERFRWELRRTQGQPRLVSALFDAHLCVAEYFLYGPVPYPEVIADAEALRRGALHAGALRGVAFAVALMGEAALLMGDLDRAERDLTEAVELHRDLDAGAGQAHALQRLAEVHLARGDTEEAARLLHRALPLARWSALGQHLLQRIYGTMIRCSPDPVAARAVVDQAAATMGEKDACTFCRVMLEVPATIACADAGDLEAARRHLTAAQESAQLWPGTAWDAAVVEARAHIALVEGRSADGATLLGAAATAFRGAGQPLDAQRCDARRSAVLALPSQRLPVP